MERGLNVLLLLLLAQGTEDAPHLPPPPQRTISRAAGTSATKVWLLFCAQLLHPSGYQTGNVCILVVCIYYKNLIPRACVCVYHIHTLCM